MGADASIELAKPFDEISKWPKGRVEAAVKAYYEGEFDFGIDSAVVMSITGYDIDEAKELVAVHSKNDSGIINAVSLMVTIIALGNCENRSEAARLESLFDLLDFNKAGRVSPDELTILLLCILFSFNAIVNGKIPEDEARDQEVAVMQYAKRILESLNKRANSPITKDEFCKWVKQHLFSKSIFHVNDVLRVMTSESLDEPVDDGDK